MRQLGTSRSHFLSASSSPSPAMFGFNPAPLRSYRPQMNSMNSVSSSEDVKPPPGLQNLGNINYQCTSPGGMSKHICSICGDRSSGKVAWTGGRDRQAHVLYTPRSQHKFPP